MKGSEATHREGFQFRPSQFIDTRSGVPGREYEPPMGDRMTHRPLEMSGGEQQRVAVVRALINRPAIVLADEPTGELDSATAGEVMQLLRALNREGQTFVIVTHDPQVAAQTDRSAYLQDGRVVREERRKSVRFFATDSG